MEGTDCGLLYFVDPVRKDFLTSASSQSENCGELPLDVCTPLEYYTHSSNLLEQAVTCSNSGFLTVFRHLTSGMCDTITEETSQERGFRIKG